MSAIQMAGLLLRAASLVLALAALQMGAVAWAWPAQNAAGAAMSVALPAVTFAIAAVVWLGAPSLARLFVVSRPTQGASGNSGASDIGELGGRIVCFAVGLGLVCFKGLTPTLQYAALMYVVASTGAQGRLNEFGLHADGLVGVASLAVGCLLIVLSRRLARRFVA